MSTFSFGSCVKVKLKLQRSVGFCGGVQGPTYTDMWSLLQRVIRHAVVFRQGIHRNRLNIGKFTQQNQQRVRANNNAIALTSKTSHPDIFQFIIRTVAGTVREVFITNVLRRANVISNPIWQRFGSNTRPFFGLVGIGLVTGGNTLTEEGQFEEICSEIRNTLRPSKEEIATNLELHELEEKLSSASLDYVGKGQCGAIYWTRLNDEDVAVKVMFNYFLESNATTILRGMARELVPSKQRIEELDFGDVKRCAPHPNIVDVKCVLTSPNVPLPGATKHWPEALPKRLNGLARNMTMYIVMKKYDCNLESYLLNNDLNLRQRVLILAQMLEGISHLKRQGIAHRDLKADNFLVKVLDYPHIVISDFGFCLASKRNPMQLHYTSPDMPIGGNGALLAPEIANATCGTFKWISYEYSDTWAVGAIAYEVFGQDNPFYTSLSSRDYTDADLPPLENVPKLLERLVLGLLRKNPRDRLSCELAAVVCYIFLWGPKNWLRKGNYYVTDVEIMRWLMLLTTKVVSFTSDSSEMNVMNSFLQRVTYTDVQKAVQFCQQ